MGMMTRIFGPNWRTTASAYVTALAAYLYTNPETLHSIPEPYQNWIWEFLKYCIYAGVISLGHTVKDKNVAGNGTVADPTRTNTTGSSFTLPAIAILMLPCLFLSGCASMTPATKAKISATGQWLAGKAVGVALSTVASVAQSEADGSAKADWLDSLGAGLLTRATASFSSADVTQLVGIWTPQKSHWEELAVQLASLAADTTSLPPAQRAEALAAGVQAAAAQLRSDSAP